MDNKKSLLRKFWKNKSCTDKYVNTTFRRRDTDKMRTRRNNKNERESLKKIAEIKEMTNDTLIPIANYMFYKEQLKQALVIMDDLKFKSQKEHWLKQRTSEESEKSWKENQRKISDLQKKVEENIIPPSKPVDPRQKEKVKPFNNKHIVPKDGNSGGSQTSYSSNNKNQDVPIKEKILSRPKSSFPEKKSLIQDKLEKSKIPTKGLSLRVRVNRSKKFSIDRYFDSEYSMNPFDCDINKEIMKFTKALKDSSFSYFMDAETESKINQNILPNAELKKDNLLNDPKEIESEPFEDNMVVLLDDRNDETSHNINQEENKNQNSLGNNEMEFFENIIKLTKEEKNLPSLPSKELKLPEFEAPKKNLDIENKKVNVTYTQPLFHSPYSLYKERDCLFYLNSYYHQKNQKYNLNDSFLSLSEEEQEDNTTIEETKKVQKVQKEPKEQKVPKTLLGHKRANDN